MIKNETINYETISKKVYEDFMNHKCIKLEDRKTIIDYKNDDTKQKMEDIIKCAKEYIKNN